MDNEAIPVYSTKDYNIVVCDAMDKDDDYKVYGIFNLKYGVRETETTVLPQAYNMVAELQESLDKCIAQAEVAAEPESTIKTIN